MVAHDAEEPMSLRIVTAAVQDDVAGPSLARTEREDGANRAIDVSPTQAQFR
jgi:hypothetical protein